MPLQSMTGYARILKTSKLAQYQIEMRSVNSKNLNLNIRLPRLYAFLEAEIHKILSQVIKRGKVDFSINIKIISDELSSIDINEERRGEERRGEERSWRRIITILWMNCVKVWESVIPFLLM